MIYIQSYAWFCHFPKIEATPACGLLYLKPDKQLLLPLMKKRILILTSLIGGSVLSQAELVHRYTFESGVSDRIGGIDGAPTTATTYTEAPVYSTDVPPGTVPSAPAQSMEVGMSYGTKKSGFEVDDSIIHLNQGAYSLWMKADVMSHGDYIFAPLAGIYGPKLVGSSATSVSVSAGSPAAIVSLPIAAGTWHHIVVSWDNVNGDLVVFLDGERAGSDTFEPYDIAPSTVRVGTFELRNNEDNFYNQYDGHLYDIQLYDGMLELDNALTLYKNPGLHVDPDQQAPSPDPAAFDVTPVPFSDTSVGMAAVPATDASSVEYYFAETSGNPGGDDSGWQTSSAYLDEGLTSGLQYSYTVRMRDVKDNLGSVSPASSVTAQAVASAAVSATQSGDWSDAATWGGAVPAFEDSVTIPMGVEVVLDGDQECGSITVKGKLVADPSADCSLRSDWVMVMGANAEFEVGTHALRYPHEFTLTLKGLPSEANSSMGSKFLGAMNGGTIHLHGPERVSWTKLGATALAGTTTLTLDDQVDWVAGEQIVITSTDTNWNHAEERVIASVSGDGLTVTLTEALEYTHTGVTETHTRPTDNKSWSIELKAEVGLLSRNVKVQGDVFSEVDGFGGHIMAMGSESMAPGALYIEGAELYRLGQTGVTGRYPVHWHLLTNQAQGQHVSNSSIHHSFSRAVTIHGTDYITVEDNFCYDHIGHGIFLENGAERFNVIRNNVVLLTRRPESGDELTPSDNEFNENQNRTPASYWITNPNNTFEDNIAAGTEGTGYWFLFPTTPLEPAGSLSYYSGDRPAEEPLGKFDRNTAHSCMNGLDINDKLNSDHSIERNGAWDHDGPFYFYDCAWFSNNVALYAGIGGRKENVIYYNNTFADNRSCLFLATYQTVEESLLIADSGHGNLLGSNVVMYEVYDGAAQMTDNHMVGWDAENATLLRNIGAEIKHVNHRFAGFTWDHDGPPRNVHRVYDDLPMGDLDPNAAEHPRLWGQVIYDLDGSVTGIAGGAIIADHPFLLTGDELKPDNWENNLISPHRFAQMRTSYGNVKLSVIRTKPGTSTEGVYCINGYIVRHHQLPFVVNDDFLYTYYFESLPSSRWVDFSFDDTEIGDAVLVRVKDFGKLNLSVTDLGDPHTSLENLEVSNSSGYYVEQGGDLYLRPVSTKRYNNNFRVQWSSAPIWPTLDSDRDGDTDKAEAAAGSDAFGFPESDNDNTEFTSGDALAGWTGNADIDELAVNEGRLQGVIYGSDPQLLKTDYSFEGNSALQVRMRYRNSSNGRVDLFWGNAANNRFSADRQLSESYTGAGDWQELIFDFGREPQWLDQEITRLRVDPNGSSGGFEIDYIRGSGPAETDYAVWAAGWSGNKLSDPWSDFNGNGLSNHAERLWGMDPFTSGSSGAITQPLDVINGVFTYTRRDVGLSGVSYSIWVSTDLLDWTEDTAAVQLRLSLNDDVETMEVTLGSGWLDENNLFIQVRAVE